MLSRQNLNVKTFEYTYNCQQFNFKLNQDAFSTLQHKTLETLKLIDTSLGASEIHEFIYSFKGLTTLDLSGNDMSTIDNLKEPGRLENLTWLKLLRNPINCTVCPTLENISNMSV